MSHHNEMEVRFLSLPENEAFARVVIAAFADRKSTRLNSSHNNQSHMPSSA